MFRTSKPRQLCWRTVELFGKTTFGNAKPLPTHIALIATYSTEPPPRKLLKFPVPTLRNTISKFVKFARPLQRDNDYHHTLAVANEFMDGVEGEKLQTLLEDRAAKLENWLTPLWIDEAYLKSRNRLPTGTSTALMFPRWNYSGRDGQVDAAAKIIHSAAKFYLKIVNNELPQDKIGKFPLDMRQYQYIFGTVRIPRLGKDSLKFGHDINPSPKHVTVIRNGNVFHLPIFDSYGRLRSLNQLKTELNNVIFPKSERVTQWPVGILTTEDRDNWAKTYAELSEENSDNLRSIENSLFVICLDSKVKSSQGLTELDMQAMQCLHGCGSQSNSINRWFDKTLQFMVGTDGFCGVNFEHAPVDAAPVAMMMDYICDHFDLDDFDGEDAVGELAASSSLEFVLSDKIQTSISTAKRKFEPVANDVEVKVFTFDRFGKTFARQYGLSPDSLTQLAIQLAYYRIHRKQPPTHQTATLRQFLNGRTGTIRLPNFYTSMFTYEMTDAEEKPNERDLVHMLQVAAQQHKNNALQTMNGYSMDRHLLGLRVLAEEKGLPIPKFFNSDAYQKMTHYTLLTSQLATRHFLPMCYGPSASDCYVVCYNPQESEIYFTVTTFKSCEKSFSSYRFAREISDALIDMRSLITKAEESARSRI